MVHGPRRSERLFLRATVVLLRVQTQIRIASELIDQIRVQIIEARDNRYQLILECEEARIGLQRIREDIADTQY